MTADALLFVSFFGTAYVLVFSFITANFTNISRAGVLISTAVALLSGLFSVVAAFMFAAQTGLRFSPAGITLVGDGAAVGAAWAVFAILMFLAELASMAILIARVGTFIHLNDHGSK